MPWTTCTKKGRSLHTTASSRVLVFEWSPGRVYVRVGDFGLATAVDHSFATALGTPRYQADVLVFECHVGDFGGQSDRCLSLVCPRIRKSEA